MDKQPNNSRAKATLLHSVQAIRQPLVATIFGLLVGAVVILACGENPFTVYAEMFSKSFLEPYYLFSTLVRSSPVIICAMATAVAWRAGYINIGVEGQMVTGTFAATLVALYVPGKPVLVGILAFLVGMVAGALYALIPAVLTWKFQVSMVICTLMMNYVANNMASYFVNYPFKDPNGDTQAAQTMQVPEGMRLLRLSKTTTLHAGFLIALAIVVIVIFITKKTVFGYESKMGGFNPSFAHAGGTKQVKVMMITMALSGAIASVAGTAEVLGNKYRYSDGMLTSTSYAWTGLMAALIADLDPVGMLLVSIFLSGLQIGGSAIQRSLGIPLDIATIIQCCITLFVSVKLTVRFAKKHKQNKETPQAPTAPAKTQEGGAQA